MTDLMGVAHRNEVVKTRRGYALLGLGFVIPGSAQAINGRRKLGRFALGLWIVLVALVILVLLLTLIFRTAMLGVFANGLVLKFIAVCVFALAVFWTGLALNTWWMSAPRKMGARKGAIFSVIALLLTVSLAAGTVWTGHIVWAAGGAFSNIFGGGGDTHQNNGRYNVLLLGSDAGPDRWGIRPDSINVASISVDTGRTVIFGLPRNLEWVPFPETSPLHAVYPDGYGCESEECLLNAVYLLGQENANLYPGVADPGIQAMIDGVSGATGLAINYYAMINMQGFIDLIDAMGGLTITINQPISFLPDHEGWLDAGVNRHLDGYETLWFARARAQTSDYDRMQRQRCVMAAMLNQLNPSDVAMKFASLAQASGEMVRTSVPSTQIATLVDLAMKARTLPITSVSFTPPLVNPASPDFSAIHAMVADTIAQSQALDNPSEPGGGQSSAAPGGEPGDSTAAQGGGDTGDTVTEDLGEVCSV